MNKIDITEIAVRTIVLDLEDYLLRLAELKPADLRTAGGERAAEEGLNYARSQLSNAIVALNNLLS